MARQTGLLKFEGTVGDLIFYKRGENYFIRSKNKFNPEKRSQRSAENSSEFSKASSGSKLIREALEPFYKSFKDGTRHNRLIKILNEIVKTDSVSERGKRNLYNGDLSLLNGFPINPTESLHEYLKPLIKIKASAADSVVLVLPKLNPETDLIKPPTSTRMHLNLMTAAFDFNKKSFTTSAVTTLEIPLSNSFAGTEIELVAGEAEGTICLVASEIQFFEDSKLIEPDGGGAAPVHIIGAALMPGVREGLSEQQPVNMPEATLAVPETAAALAITEIVAEQSETSATEEEQPVAPKKKVKTAKAPKAEPEKPSGGQLSLL